MKLTTLCAIRAFVLVLLSFLLLPTNAVASDLSVQDKILEQINRIKQNPESAEQLFGGYLPPPSIIGGVGTARSEFKEYALVVLTNGAGRVTGLCGGTMITPDKLITAAHCSLQNTSNYIVIPGFYSFNDNIKRSSLAPVFDINIHPNYTSAAFGNDIAIMRLSAPTRMPTAAVVRGNNRFIDTQGTVIGTGLTANSPTPRSPTVLQKVAARVISNRLCSQTYLALTGQDPISGNVMCAGFTTNGNGSCAGDSGGPLFSNIDGVRTIIGVVSFGINPCEQNRATQGYARVTSFTDFIEFHAPNTRFISSYSANNVTGALMLLLTDETSGDPVDPPEPDAPFPPIAKFTEGKYKIALQSDIGDTIGRGKNYTYNPLNSNIRFRKLDNNTLRINIDGFGSAPDQLDNWSWEMEAIGPGLLAGTYSNVTRYPFNSGNGFNFSGNGHGCSTLTGEFRIFEIEMLGEEITKLVADFTQYCGSGFDKLRGSIVYDSSNTPLTYTVPELTDISPNPPLPALSGPGTVIKIESEPGDPIGIGQNYLFDQSNSTITVDNYFNSDRGAQVSITTEDFGSWWLQMRRGQLDIDPDREKPLSRGIYPNTYRGSSSSPAPGLSVVGNAVSCAGTGELRVFEVSYNAAGDIEKLIADFSQTCRDFTVGLRGSIHFDNTISPPT